LIILNHYVKKRYTLKKVRAEKALPEWLKKLNPDIS
jgi:hypothetical protein